MIHQQRSVCVELAAFFQMVLSGDPSRQGHPKFIRQRAREALTRGAFPPTIQPMGEAHPSKTVARQAQSVRQLLEPIMTLSPLRSSKVILNLAS